MTPGGKRTLNNDVSGITEDHDLETHNDLCRIYVHKIATHNILRYVMTDPVECFRTIATEQVQRGDTMALDTLLPGATADLIAKTFFDFVVKHNLADTMTSMNWGLESGGLQAGPTC